jgi:hypothetical protein
MVRHFGNRHERMIAGMGERRRGQAGEDQSGERGARHVFREWAVGHGVPHGRT